MKFLFKTALFLLLCFLAIVASAIGFEELLGNTMAGVATLGVVASIIALFAGAERWRTGLGRSLLFCSGLYVLAATGFQTIAYKGAGEDAVADSFVRNSFSTVALLLAFILGIGGWLALRRTPSANVEALASLGDDLPFLKEFIAKFETDVGPWLNDQEGRRRKVVRHRAIAWMVFVPSMVAVTVLVGQIENTVLKNLVFWISLLGGIAWAESPLLVLKEEIRKKLLEHLCDFLQLQHTPSGKVPVMPLYGDMQLVPPFGKYDMRDIFNSAYHGIQMVMGYTSFGRDAHIFKGITIGMTFPLPFKGRTKVLRDLGKIGNYFKNRKVPEDRINLGYSSFEKIFEVYGTDQIEARVLLTPDVLENLIKLAKLLSGDDCIQFGFVNNLMLISIQTDTNPFADIGPMDVEMKDRNRIARFVKAVGLMHTVIDTLELARKKEGFSIVEQGAKVQ